MNRLILVALLIIASPPGYSLTVSGKQVEVGNCLADQKYNRWDWMVLSHWALAASGAPSDASAVFKRQDFPETAHKSMTRLLDRYLFAQNAPCHKTYIESVKEGRSLEVSLRYLATVVNATNIQGQGEGHFTFNASGQ